jgi:spermidine dehydrogenase
MDRAITRRDVLHGLALAGAGALTGAGGLLPLQALAAEAATTSTTSGDYPPEWTGLRGSTTGTFENAHALRDGKSWSDAQDTGEEYDLVVVGSGISGLAAAYFYRAQTSPNARILILDNHDDFGGHARRNEFHLGGRLHLLNGGTFEIDSPYPYSSVAAGLLRDLGIDVEALLKKAPNPKFFDVSENRTAMFFDRETFGADKLIKGRGGKSWEYQLRDAPLNAHARADIVRLADSKTDYLAGMPMEQKRRVLSSTSYRDFLGNYAKVDPQVLQVFDSLTKGYWGVGIDAVSALDVWGLYGERARGMQHLGLVAGDTTHMGFSPAGYSSTGGSTRYHFPDGNATIARALVRSLVPNIAAPGSVDQMVSTRFDYSQLDQADAPVRVRLRSTVIRARNVDAARPQDARVAVDYVRGDKAMRVRARNCVLACYNMIIPYLCPELPPSQKEALHELVKTPLLYTSVAIRNARAFDRIGVSHIDSPGLYHTTTLLNPYMAIGPYRGPKSPDDPTLVHMQRTPCKAGLSEKDQNRAGRMELLATSFETMERSIRDQLARMLGPGGFDPARDITAITVNRWAHGYAPEFNPLFEPELPAEKQAHVIGRTRFGRISIANSDSGGGAYTDVAIDQGHRAIGEILGNAPV